MVKGKGLTLKLGKKTILDKLDFELKPGRTTVILGRNGSGKTSLMRVLSSLYRYEGSVEIEGRELKEIPYGERSSYHASIPQTLEPVRFTVEELLEFSNNKERAGEAIAHLGMEHLSGKDLSAMSSGERALSYLSLLWSQDARLYLLDEPEASLDVNARNTLYKAIEELKKRNAAILVSMHGLGRAMAVADDILVLRKGKIVFSGTKDEFIASSVPKTIFGVEPRTVEVDGREVVIFL